MLAASLVLVFGALGAVTWFKILRPLASVLELSEQNELDLAPPAPKGTVESGAPTNDLIRLIEAVHGATDSVTPQAQPSRPNAAVTDTKRLVSAGLDGTERKDRLRP